jgi:predicted transcriptional regulator
MTGTHSGTEEVVDVLASRDDILGALASGPQDIRDLRDELECSRSTAYKAVRELQTEELAEDVDGDYRLTLLGRLLFRRYRRFLAETDDLLDIRDVLAALPADLPIDPALFSDATVYVADAIAPDRPVDALESFIGEATRFRTFTPVQRARYHSYATDLLESRDVVIEMVVERDVIEYAISNHPEEMRAILENENTTHYETDASLPFGLVAMDDPERRVGVTLYDDRKHLQAFVVSDDPGAYEWAEETYESYRQDATELTPETSEAVADVLD